jgi:hypothetical protein
MIDAVTGAGTGDVLVLIGFPDANEGTGVVAASLLRIASGGASFQLLEHATLYNGSVVLPGQPRCGSSVLVVSAQAGMMQPSYSSVMSLCTSPDFVQPTARRAQVFTRLEYSQQHDACAEYATYRAYDQYVRTACLSIFPSGLQAFRTVTSLSLCNCLDSNFAPRFSLVCPQARRDLNRYVEDVLGSSCLLYQQVFEVSPFCLPVNLFAEAEVAAMQQCFGAATTALGREQCRSNLTAVEATYSSCPAWRTQVVPFMESYTCGANQVEALEVCRARRGAVWGWTCDQAPSVANCPPGFLFRGDGCVPTCS